MTSKSLQVILIVILSVLAYSCGEDNPVVEPPENQDSLRIVKLSKNSFKSGEEIYLTYWSLQPGIKILKVKVDDIIADFSDQGNFKLAVKIPKIYSKEFKIVISDGNLSASSEKCYNNSFLRIIQVNPIYYKQSDSISIQLNKSKFEIGNNLTVYIGGLQHQFKYADENTIRVKPLSILHTQDSVKIVIRHKDQTDTFEQIYYCTTPFYENDKLSVKRVSSKNIREKDTILLAIFGARANERTLKFYLNEKKVNYLSWKNDSQDGNQFVRVTLLAPKFPLGNVTLRVVDYLGSYEINDFNYVENKDNIKSLLIKFAKIKYLRYNKTTEYFGGGGGSKVSTYNDTLFYDLNVKLESIKAENFYSDLSKFGYFKEYSTGDHSIGPPPTSSSSTGQYSYLFSKDQTNNKFLGIEIISNNKNDFYSGASYDSHSENSTSILLNNLEFSYDYLSKKYTIILKGEDVLQHISTFIYSKSSRGGDPGHYLTEDRYAIKLLENQPPEATIEISFELY